MTSYTKKNFSSLNSNDLKNKIEDFKTKFSNKVDYFTCEQDMISLVIIKYINIVQKFLSLLFNKNNSKLLIKIYKLINRRFNKRDQIVDKFFSLEKRLNYQQKVVEQNFELNSKLQKEVEYIKDNFNNNYINVHKTLDEKTKEIIGHNSGQKTQTSVDHNITSKVDFYQEENLRLGSELVETKKKFEILKSEIEKYENQRSELISKINSVNDVINDSNVLTNVFENNMKPKIEILDHNNIQNNSDLDINEQVKAIFSKK